MDKKELLRLLEIHTKGTGLFPETMMAQMITESGMNRKEGLSELSLKYNNYSGQKASGVTLSKGKEGVDYVIMGTEEDFSTKKEAEAYLKKEKKKGETGGKKSKIEANPAGGFTVTLGQPFRIFKTPEEGVKGHIRFLTGEGYSQSQKARYAEVRAAKTPEEQIKKLKESGYATDSEYVKTLTNVLNDSVRVEFPQFKVKTPEPTDESIITDSVKDKKINEQLSTAFKEPVEDVKESIRNAVLDVGIEMQRQFENDELGIEDTSDTGMLNEFLKRVKTQIGLDDVDITDVEQLANARGMLSYVTEIANEELGEQIKRGWLNFDSKIEDVFEDSDNRKGRNLKVLGIPPLGESSLETDKVKLEQEIRKIDGGGSEGVKPAILQEGEQKTNLIKVINDNPDLLKRKIKEGLTNEELAQKLYDEQLQLEQEEEDEAIRQDLSQVEDPLEGMDEIDDEEEESMESLGLNEDGSQKSKRQRRKERRKRKREGKLTAEDKAFYENRRGTMLQAEKVLTGLKAAAGVLSLSQALKDPDVETPEISPLVTEALNKQRQLAESGLTASEKNVAMQNLNDAYAGAMKNVLRASGGQRGLFLANQGTVDANRIKGLNELAALDAAQKRQNISQYNKLANSVGTVALNRDMTVEQMRQTTLNNNRKVLSGIGTNLLSDALSDVSYYMNPNREATQALFDQIKNGSNTADTSGFNKNVNLAETNIEDTKENEKPDKR